MLCSSTKVEGNDIHVENLIDLVKQYDVLYNIHEKDYRNASKRQEAWEEIGKAMSLPWQACKDDWTKLRNAFTNAIKRRSLKSGEAAHKISPWKFEYQMSFLKPFLEGRRMNNNSECNFFTDGDDYRCPTDVLVLSTSEETSGVLCPNSGSKASPKMELLTDDLQDVAPIYNRFQNNRQVPKSSSEVQITKAEHSLDQLIFTMKTNNKILTEIASVQQLNYAADETELFYLSMARTIKKLPRREQIRIRQKFCSLVSESELKICSPPSSSILSNSVTQDSDKIS